MRKITLLGYIFLQLTFSSFAIQSKNDFDPPADRVFISLYGLTNPISLADFVKLDLNGFKRLIGQKLSIGERISFRINQKRFRKCIRQDGTVNMTKFNKTTGEPFRFNIGGFLLGFIGWVPGLIAGFFIDNKKNPKNTFISALIGCIISPWSFILLFGYLISGFGVY